MFDIGVGCLGGKLKLLHVLNIGSNNHGIPSGEAIANKPFSEHLFLFWDRLSGFLVFCPCHRLVFPGHLLDL